MLLLCGALQTNGSLKPEELVRDAINVLEKKTREIGEEVKKLNWHEAGGEGGGGGGRGGAPWETGRPAFHVTCTKLSGRCNPTPALTVGMQAVYFFFCDGWV